MFLHCFNKFCNDHGTGIRSVFQVYERLYVFFSHISIKLRSDDGLLYVACTWADNIRLRNE